MGTEQPAHVNVSKEPMHQTDRRGTSRHYRVFTILTKTNCSRQKGPFRRSSRNCGAFAQDEDNRSRYLDPRIATAGISGSRICSKVKQ
ncbi:hypothetical protein AVEN_181330-1 [Araneus ventricosus]|uniref:Uncharacterized protein n=1 Tax=Araneus ventricosus TaxID=182803 RepID=A0A4Y2LG33_ARAVE|nr:hypothetical protein AVEN_181330-1 [Araneus ventricosus]